MLKHHDWRISTNNINMKFWRDEIFCEKRKFFKLSAILCNCFLCQDHVSGDVPPDLAQPCYSLLGRLWFGACTKLYNPTLLRVHYSPHALYSVVVFSHQNAHHYGLFFEAHYIIIQTGIRTALLWPSNEFKAPALPSELPCFGKK